MKRILTLLICIITSFCSIGQEDTVTQNKITVKKGPIYSILLGEYIDNVPIEFAKMILDLDNVNAIKTKSTVKYYWGQFYSDQDAIDNLNKLKDLGFENISIEIIKKE